MNDLRATNWLLVGILIALVAHLGVRLGVAPAIAETLRLDNCITSKPNDKPAAYVHVVTHQLSGE